MDKFAIKRKKNKKGFTLVEILLYIAIAGGIIFSITVFFLTTLDARVRNQAIAEVEEEGTQVMQNITQTIRNSSSINSPSQGTSSASISLAVIDGAKDPTVFDVSGNVIRVKEGTEENIDLTSSRVIVSGLNFANLSRTGTGGAIRIQFTLTHINPASKEAYDYSKTFYGSASIR